MSVAVWPSLRVAVTVQRASSLDHEACVTLCPKRMWSVMPFSRAVSSMYSRMSVPSAMVCVFFQGLNLYPSVYMSVSERTPG